MFRRWVIVEVLAILKGMKIVEEAGLSPLNVESDSKNSVNIIVSLVEESWVGLLVKLELWWVGIINIVWPVLLDPIIQWVIV